MIAWLSHSSDPQIGASAPRGGANEVNLPSGSWWASIWSSSRSTRGWSPARIPISASRPSRFGANAGLSCPDSGRPASQSGSRAMSALVPGSTTTSLRVVAAWKPSGGRSSTPVSSTQCAAGSALLRTQGRGSSVKKPAHGQSTPCDRSVTGLTTGVVTT